MFGFSKYFWISSSLFVLNQLVEKLGYSIFLIHSYLDDVLCAGIVLGLALFVQQQFTYKKADFTLSKGNIIFFVIWFSLLFEVLFPIMDDRHHADFWDVPAYILGAIIYYRFGNKPANRLYFFKVKLD